MLMKASTVWLKRPVRNFVGVSDLKLNNNNNNNNNNNIIINNKNNNNIKHKSNRGNKSKQVSLTLAAQCKAGFEPCDERLNIEFER